MRLPVNRFLYRVLQFFGFSVAWDTSVGAIIFCTLPEGREYLLLRYPSGHFDYARGHVEKNETKEETARREVQEETGIEDIRFYFEKEMKTKFFYSAKGQERERREAEGRGIWIFKEVFMYPAEVPSKLVSLSDEHLEYLWLPYGEGVARVTFPNAKNLLRETEVWLKEKKKTVS